MAYDKKMLGLFVDVGREMLQSGAEIGRADTTIKLMGLAYGAARMDILAITDYLVVTMSLPDGVEYTITRRIEGGSTDFSRIEALNELSRSFCTKPFSEQELRERLDVIRNNHIGNLKKYAGTMMVGFMFSAFFGGSLLDAVVCCALAFPACFLGGNLSRLCSSNIFYNFLCALFSGIMACIAAMIIPAVHLDKLMIGLIMIFIPGRALTNSIKDIFLGDTLSGMMRMTEALFCGAAIAFGFIIPVYVTGI
ncbi:MAG: threonine/serine exporter family protein [Lachnospiraceae bacterium]|nr:threonine/serine exporter family protein [Lachnospiraceae bacterium]